ncbi:putative F-box domain, leucine-rich repeat domain, L domain-containing protein [Lupinus albus]|uniref:Putative F-box domain, leucine-rich repeat domain, L domain-containing protein n=1 Tax=Lupinus albus TaxID=3870 RepID=A0A6A4QRY8_LUPAL|nr:putative F-box domain, leucine-rich repeat domain, L domain-containing protein [Lupinus albus]
MKRTRRIARIERESMERDMENLQDRLSDLPDCVLHNIMKFMNAKHVVQTCVLSKRWKNLWKSSLNLTFDSSDFLWVPVFNNFVSRVLSCRDNSMSIHSLDFRRKGCIGPKILHEIMTYAASHDVQQFTINVNLVLKQDFMLPSCIYNCPSLKSLKLYFWFPYAFATHIKLPTSFNLPTLETMYIKHVTFSENENGCVEPFSSCNMLNTLVIDHCYLLNATKPIHISNSKLSNLTIRSFRGDGVTYEIALSTPNLSEVTIQGFPDHKLSSMCNVPNLEKVKIEVTWYESFPTNHVVLISMLQVFAKVKILTLSWKTIKTLNDLLSTSSFRTQLPAFVRLRTLKLKMKSFSTMSNMAVREMVEYLLHNSPATNVDVLKCCKCSTLYPLGI